jgi:uncharacterized protein (DUF111 family)
VEAELTTPTGAAILAAMVAAFGPPPEMTLEKIGYGAGTRDFAEQPNLLRVLIGEVKQSQGSPTLETENLCQLETNLDDASGELIGHCVTRLFETGALDVYTCGVQMKKNRPGVLLSVLCQPLDAERLEAILFRETTTLGVRRSMISRRKLHREPHQVQTQWGPVNGVLATLPGGQMRFSPEYESCRLIAQMHSIPLGTIYEEAIRARSDGH